MALRLGCENQARRAGKLTIDVYNGQPDPFNGNAIASCASASARLVDGKPIAVLCKSAARMGVTQAAYAQMERVNHPRKATIQKVTDALGIEAEQLRWYVKHPIWAYAEP